MPQATSTSGETARELVERIAKREFPQANPAEILEILAGYGIESHEAGWNRVQLAILMRSRGRLDLLTRQVANAKADFRDVLVAAEYPLEFDATLPDHRADAGTIAGARAEDKRNYRDWLEGRS